MTRISHHTGDDQYDVAVVGGGPAGLSAALVLGRAGRSVLVIDHGRSPSASAADIPGFLSHGVPPGDLLRAARQEVVGHGSEVRAGEVLSAAHDGIGFRIELDTGREVRARRLLAAAGVTVALPDVPGLAARWGRDVMHCPYWHSWIREQPIGVLATDPLGVHQALLFRQWSHRVTLLLHTAAPPTAREAERLAARGITVTSGEVTGLEVTGDRLSGVRLRSDEQIPLRALAVAPRPVPRAEFLAPLGLVPTPYRSGLGACIAADPTGLTPIPGVRVAGTIADPDANVLESAASGSRAAGAINADLVAEDTREAVRAQGGCFSPVSEARVCELIMGDRRHGL